MMAAVAFIISRLLLVFFHSPIAYSSGSCAVDVCLCLRDGPKKSRLVIMNGPVGHDA